MLLRQLVLKKVVLENAFNRKVKVLHLKKELCLNTSSIGCFDDPSTRVSQVQLCKFTKLVGQVFGQKWRVSSSTPYPLRQAYHYSSWSRLFLGWKDKVGGWVSKSGDELKIARTSCYNGCTWVHNYNKTS
jgi:hypothetical protein